MLSAALCLTKGALQQRQSCLLACRSYSVIGASSRSSQAAANFLTSSNYETTLFASTSYYKVQKFSSGLTKEEEENEKNRVSSLSPEIKSVELRQLDDEIKRLHVLRGINTGELYTWRGKMKALARDYGTGFVVWYYTVWCAMFSVTFVAIEYGGVDALALVSKMDAYTGFDMASRINPTVGSLAVALIANECLEPIRLVFVVSTTKPVVHMFTGRT